MSESVLLPVEEVIWQIKKPGNVYVNAAITCNDTHMIQVKKSYILQLLSRFEKGTKIGYSTFDDGTDAILLDSYGLR